MFTNFFILTIPYYRFNGLLGQDLQQHPGMFLFMNRLRTTVFENAFSVLAKVDAGRTIKHNSSRRKQQWLKSTTTKASSRQKNSLKLWRSTSMIKNWTTSSRMLPTKSARTKPPAPRHQLRVSTMRIGSNLVRSPKVDYFTK